MTKMWDIYMYTPNLTKFVLLIVFGITNPTLTTLSRFRGSTLGLISIKALCGIANEAPKF